MRRDLELPSEQCLRGGGAEANDRARLDQLDFCLEPRSTRRDFTGIRFLVDAPLSSRLPLEVFHDVRHVDGTAIDASLLQRAVEQLPGWTDERTTSEIFGVARLLADQHQLGPARTLAEDGLRGVLPEITRPAAFRGCANVGQRRP